MVDKKLIVLQLNEINFDFVRKYSTRHPLPNFRRLLSEFQQIETFSEAVYDELEPWIQWVSAYTGKTYREHGVFRLGDIVNTDLPQIFEVLEAKGLRVGALSPMNARNDLKHPAYFVPDPWTRTPSDTSPFSMRLTDMLRQTVNDNAQQRITSISMTTLLEAVLRSFNPRGTLRLLMLIGRSLYQPWHKPLVLDQLIHLLHWRLLKKRQPDVSFIFLNGGAHIQHHYFFNCEFVDRKEKNPSWYITPQADPCRDMLLAYDSMLGDYLHLVRKGDRLIVATGLTQVPYDKVKFYYRLKDHATFLRRLNLSFVKVLPRMTRDFEITFDNVASTQICMKLLQSMRLQRDGIALFEEIEDRGLSLFVTLTYPNEIRSDDVALGSNGEVIPDFGHLVAFVAIKNGMHVGRGFAYISPNVTLNRTQTPVHVAALFALTLDAALQ